MMKVPTNWIASSLGEICSQPQYGYTTKGTDTGTLRLLRTTDITSGDICWNSVPFCLENPTDEDKYLLEDGDIVISRAGSVGVSYLLKNPERSVFASYLIRFKPYIDIQYFKYFLDSPYYWQEIADNKLGIAVPNVNASKLKEIAIPLAPENEQHRIVAKIEELFSELDKGIENLKTAQAQLKVYRQTLLKHAFEGKLTAQWRAENRDKLESSEALLKRIQQERAQRYQQQLADWEKSKSPSVPLLQRGKKTEAATIASSFAKASIAVPHFEKGGLGGISKPKAPKSLEPLTAEELAELPELPEGWTWVRVGEIADVQLGRQRSPSNRSNYFPTKYIRAGNLTDSGLNLDDVLDMEFEPQERARFLLKAGDVLLSEASGSANQVGKPAVWRGEIEECCFQNTVIRVRSLAELSEYLFWIFKKYYISGVFSKLSGGVGINHLSAGKLGSMVIPLVAISEAEEILELINEKLSLIDNLDQTITTSLQQAEALRQSILKKAFSGQLVEQDPHDEPASALLARIKAERATVAKNATVAAKPRKTAGKK